MLLQKFSEEHRMFHNHVQKFQSWLVSKTKELTELMKLEETPENKLRALKVSQTAANSMSASAGRSQVRRVTGEVREIN